MGEAVVKAKLGEEERRGQFYLPVKQTMKFSSQRPINDSFYGYGTHQLGDKKAKLDLLTSKQGLRGFFSIFQCIASCVSFFPASLATSRFKKEEEKGESCSCLGSHLEKP